MYTAMSMFQTNNHIIYGAFDYYLLPPGALINGHYNLRLCVAGRGTEAVPVI